MHKKKSFLSILDIDFLSVVSYEHTKKTPFAQKLSSNPILGRKERRVVKKIAFFSQKGGVGKSTLVANTAGSLSKSGHSVLVVDLDGQGTTTSYLTTIKDNSTGTVYDLITETKAGKDLVCPVEFDKWDPKTQKRVPLETNISLLPASHEITSPEFYMSFKDKDLFKRFFKELGQEYDFCLFDCPGYANMITESALIASDYIIAPAFADTDSIKGIGDLMDTRKRIRTETDNISLEVLGVIFTCYQNTSFSRQIRDYISESWQGIVFGSTIRKAAIIPESRYLGIPMAYYKPKENVTTDFAAFTEEMIARIKNGRKN